MAMNEAEKREHSTSAPTSMISNNPRSMRHDMTKRSTSQTVWLAVTPNMGDTAYIKVNSSEIGSLKRLSEATFGLPITSRLIALRDAGLPITVRGNRMFMKNGTDIEILPNKAAD